MLLEKSIRFLCKLFIRSDANWRGVLRFPPGHFYSPLLDIKNFRIEDTALPNDGPEDWENIDLLKDEQHRYYQYLVENIPVPPFPKNLTAGVRYYWDNIWFVWPDAFTLYGILRREQPKRIIEIGSGFSSAVMLDTLEGLGAHAEVTFIEPYPDRLYSLLSSKDRLNVRILEQKVQEVSSALFESLEANDILFVDSSHVAKVGSDVSFLLLRILPRLRPGVIVHFHDICYPNSYPAEWIREGRAWNETLFLRAFLIGNQHFQVFAFNQFAAYSFPELFRERIPEFLAFDGGSIWIRKIS